jgi:hypothetical protein
MPNLPAAAVVAVSLPLGIAVGFFAARSVDGGAPVAPAGDVATGPTAATTATRTAPPGGDANATRGPAARERRNDADGAGSPVPLAPGGERWPTPPPSDRGPRTLERCEAEVAEQREQLASVERRRKELEGEPIAARTDTPPRFQAPGLVQTFERAFAQTRLVGKVESVDCTEHPCILFGRLRGDEEGVATLEDAEPFAAYDDDVGVMLTWASGDHGHEGGVKPGLQREKPPEISLFAFAYYTHEDREQHGEMIDRRIRVRTAEYWNASAVRE